MKGIIVVAVASHLSKTDQLIRKQQYDQSTHSRALFNTKQYPIKVMHHFLAIG
ncbi:hypothetical protein FBR4_0070 [Lactiplantibacillus plantarum]|nr:hypothetical protein FBR4_0070 [Lactiplantibacillus plantarum]